MATTYGRGRAATAGRNPAPPRRRAPPAQGGTIHRANLTPLRMALRGEPTVVIDRGRVVEWTGMGWAILHRRATRQQIARYPTAVGDEVWWCEDDARKRYFATLREAGVTDRAAFQEAQGLPPSTKQWGEQEYLRAVLALMEPTVEAYRADCEASAVHPWIHGWEVLGHEPDTLRDFHALLPVVPTDGDRTRTRLARGLLEATPRVLAPNTAPREWKTLAGAERRALLAEADTLLRICRPPEADGVAPAQAG